MNNTPSIVIGLQYSNDRRTRQEHQPTINNYRNILDADELFGIGYDFAEHLDWTLRDFAEVVTKERPFRMRFTKERRYRHTNQRFDHRFNRSRQQGRRVSNLPPCDVNEYIRRCEAVNAIDGRRYSSMPNSGTARTSGGHFTQTRQTAWITRWKHTGGIVRGYPTVQPADSLYLRCVEEKEYQRRLVNFINLVLCGEIYLEGDQVYYNDPSLDLTTLPRPITGWYQFSDRIYWVEDAGYEHRQRVPGPTGGLLLPWHELGAFAMPFHQRRRNFFQTDDTIRSFDRSRLTCTPTTPMAAYAKGVMETATPSQRWILQNN